MGVQSLSQEDPLGEEMATHSSILGQSSLDKGAWYRGHQELDTTEDTYTHTHTLSIGRMGSISEDDSDPKIWDG